MYLLLGNNRAIAGYTKALEFRNGKSFRRVTEEGYIAGADITYLVKV
ncbi:Mobile element protein [Nostoc flagelliforme CCNUN1]|uniref:Mobile element protein n=1 Tax=Nostoc flagelliforme CCNUN1 TaxID=2038116 RepID=A0A2K8SNG4_9NOSO|nr:Mobile element protein [Nostoc flagelliforme CCNUN1]